MRIGLYGGTFDPVHLGHIHAALAVKHDLQLDHVRMVLSARPGHRDQPNTANTHRWKMLKLACDEHSALVADDTELQRPGCSYAIDTLQHFRARYPRSQLCWIMGMDSYLTLPTWRNWQTLVKFAHLIVVQRPGQPTAVDQQLASFQHRLQAGSLDTSRAGSIVFLPIPMLDISATQVRCLAQSEESPEALLSASVWTYINRNHLYLTKEGSFESQ